MFNTANLMLEPLLISTWQTLYMVFISSFFSLALGLAVGTLLFLTDPGQRLEKGWFNRSLGIIVNIVRSIPYIIFMIALIPLTRFVVGTSIGTNAAIVPLTLAAIPFFARIVQAAISEVDTGKVEAITAMGATTWQIVTRVYWPEALPSLIKGGTLTVVGLVGYSAMAGAVGGGGLGQLAINYGYQQFNLTVMIETIIVLVILVQLIQSAGDYCAAKRRFKPIIGICIIFWLACILSAWPHHKNSEDTVKLGVMSGAEAKIMKIAQRVAAQKYHLQIKLVTFDSYMLPNEALNDGELDANLFQHVPFLNTQIKQHGYKLSPIARTFVYPMGFFSKQIHALKQLKPGDIVAIPNDPSNEGRALRLLQVSGVIQLKPGVGIMGTTQDIVSNPDHLMFKTMAAAQLPRVMKDATLVALTNDFIGPAGYTVNQAVIHEGAKAPYANVVVVRTSDIKNPIYKHLVAAIHSQAVLKATLKEFPDGGAIKAW